MRRKWRYVAVAACMGLIAAACGGDDDDGGGAEGTDRRRPVPKPKARKRPPQRSPRPRRHRQRRRRPRHQRRTTEAEEETGASVDPASIEFDVGVDDTTIRVGMLADLSGAFAPLVQEIVEAQRVYWDDVNANGGIAGRQVELVIEDNALRRRPERREVPDPQGPGGDHQPGHGLTAHGGDRPGPRERRHDRHPAVVVLGLGRPRARGERARDVHQLLHRVDERRRVVAEEPRRPDVAIISFPGEYGGDGAEGAKLRRRGARDRDRLRRRRPGDAADGRQPEPGPERRRVADRRRRTPTWCGRRSTRRRCRRS